MFSELRRNEMKTINLLSRILVKNVIIVLFLLGLTCSAWTQVKSEVEPNDSLAQAQDIRIGDTVEGYFQKDYEYDCYRLTIDKSGKNYLQVDLSAVPGIDASLYFYDGNG